MLYGLILVVHIFVCFVLIAVILLQAGRGGGLSDSFGGGAAQSLFGTRGTVYLTRATSICAFIFMLTSLSLAILSVQQGRSLMGRVPVSPRATRTPKPTESTPATAPQRQPAQQPQQQPQAQAAGTGADTAAKGTQKTEQKTGDQK